MSSYNGDLAHSTAELNDHDNRLPDICDRNVCSRFLVFESPDLIQERHLSSLSDNGRLSNCFRDGFGVYTDTTNRRGVELSRLYLR